MRFLEDLYAGLRHGHSVVGAVDGEGKYGARIPSSDHPSAVQVLVQFRIAMERSGGIDRNV